MNIKTFRCFVVFLTLVASLFLLDAHAAKPEKVTVTAAFPDSALQGDATEVEIDGTGFDAGSTARFIVTDSRDDTQIDVTEVTFDTVTGKLKAKIKVKDAALPVEYDIEVKTSSGRRGKGTTLFRVREKAVQDDPCINMESFSPDFAFLRDTGNRKSPKITIVLAESTTGCEESLVEFPVISPVLSQRNLRFSSVADDSGFFGRVVWTSHVPPIQVSVWKQDFHIVGAELIFDGGPLEILRNMLVDDPLERETIWSLDLSPDMRTLVYVYYHSYPDPDDVDTYMRFHSLRMLNIDSCESPETNPCRFDDLVNAYELDLSSDTLPFNFPSWGPFGERIYVRREFSDPVLGRYSALQYFDLEQNWQALDWPPVVINKDTIISDFGKAEDIITDYGYFSKVSSGIMDGIEYLAIEDEFSTKTGGCKGFFIVNAEDCLINRNCTTEPQFAGNNPSWSKDGKLIHAYDGWAPHGGCTVSSVGAWDGSDGSLESLIDGYWPDAASGIR